MVNNKITLLSTNLKTNYISVDPVGKIYFYQNRIFRCINNSYIEQIEDLLNCGLLQELINLNLFPKFEIVDDIIIDDYELIIEHEKIPFAIEPCEWSFNMLKDITITTLTIIEIANKYGYTLKDGHPTNFSFFGYKPIFFDIGSFTKKDSDNWLAHGEFLESTLIPLIVWSNGDFYFANRLLSDYIKKRYSPYINLIEHSYIINCFSIKNIDFNIISKSNYSSIKESKKIISSIKKSNINSEWQNYHDIYFTNNNFLNNHRFNRYCEILINYNIDSLIDLAGNNGIFSILASMKGIKNILCTDYDENSIDNLYLLLKNDLADCNITPMVSNVIFPHLTPINNIYDRLKADAVVALALTHHLILSQNIPIENILKTIDNYSNMYVGIEFMPLGLWGGGALPEIPEWYTSEWFRINFQKHFYLLVEEQIEENRIFFWGIKKMYFNDIYHKKNFVKNESYPMTWEEAVTWIRTQPEFQELSKACYFDEPLLEAAKRFHKSDEWQETKKYLPASPCKVLDLGAGRGISTFSFAMDGYEVIALEPNPSEIVGAGAIKNLFDDLNLKIDILQEWGESLPFTDDYFDIVYARQLLHHANDLSTMCKEIYRVLKPEGIFISTREHVVDAPEEMKIFYQNHPMHHLFGGENAFSLNQYINSMVNGGFIFKKILSHYESIINYYPISVEIINQQMKDLWHWPWTPTVDELIENSKITATTPGRLYTFILAKITENNLKLPELNNHNQVISNAFFNISQIEINKIKYQYDIINSQYLLEEKIKKLYLTYNALQSDYALIKEQLIILRNNFRHPIRWFMNKLFTKLKGKKI